jgi:hypothetical protein
MTRDELRGLMGGYATGSLSEAERKILFEAAIEDQELFDELAREQALKAVLEEPGAKERLLAAVQPTGVSAKPWWKLTWVWAAAIAASAVVIGAIWLVRSSTVRVEEVARLETPEVPAVPAPKPAPEPAPAPPPVTAPAPKQVRPERQAAPPPQAPSAQPARVDGADRVQPVNPAEVDAAQKAVAAPRAQAFAQGTIGGIGGVVAPLAAAPPALAAKAPRFAFDYSVTPQSVLRVLPYANAFLSVSVTTAAGTQPLVVSRPVQAGVQTEVQLPDDATSAIVVFSAQATGGFGGGAGAADPLS